MACGTPCVTTGDALLIVRFRMDSAGKRSEVLSEAIIQAIREQQEYNPVWMRRKEICRSRIVNKFSMQKMIEGYYDVCDNGR